MCDTCKKIDALNKETDPEKLKEKMEEIKGEVPLASKNPIVIKSVGQCGHGHDLTAIDRAEMEFLKAGKNAPEVWLKNQDVFSVCELAQLTELWDKETDPAKKQILFRCYGVVGKDRQLDKQTNEMEAMLTLMGGKKLPGGLPGMALPINAAQMLGMVNEEETEERQPDPWSAFGKKKKKETIH